MTISRRLYGSLWHARPERSHFYSRLRLGWKLAGPGLPGVIAAFVAAVGILAMTGWLRGVAVGASEGLLIALVLAAVDRHLAGRRDQAFLLGTGAALLRPEVWPFLALYGVVLWASHPRWRARILAAGLLVLALWFLPELWGSGNLLRSAERAHDPLSTSIAFADRPALEVLRSTSSLLVAPLYAAALVAVCVAIVAFRRRRAQSAVLAIALLAGGWTGLIMLMTEAGYSGNPRYLMLVGALTSVLAGVGVARLVQAGADAAKHFGIGAQAGAAIATAVFVGILALSWPGRELAADLQAVRSQSAATPQLEQLVARLGGPAAVLACGRPTAGPFQRPIMAWTLGVHARDVAFVLEPGAPGLVFHMRTQRARDPASPNTEPRYRAVAELGQWEVFAARCTGGRDVATYRAAAG